MNLEGYNYGPGEFRSRKRRQGEFRRVDVWPRRVEKLEVNSSQGQVRRVKLWPRRVQEP